MIPERREELISAYLDGELAPDERAQVEKWLEESPELRQLHDDLRWLGSSIRSLPRHKLDQDLATAVVRRAERTVLGGDSQPSPAPEVRPGQSIATWWLRGAGWRRLAWPALALAAALMILLFNSDEREAQREVAQAPKDAPKTAARRDAPGEADGSRPQGAVAMDNEQDAYRAASSAQGEARLEKPAGAMRLKSPAGAVPATAPALGAAADRETTQSSVRARKMSAAVDERLDAVVCEVTPEFLRDKGFEKLLERLNVVGSVEEAPSPDAAVVKNSIEPAPPEAKTPSMLRPDSRRAYVVQATEEQVAKIITELSKQADQVKRVSDERSRSEKESRGRTVVVGARRHHFVLQMSPAAPAEPVEGESKP